MCHSILCSYGGFLATCHENETSQVNRLIVSKYVTSIHRVDVQGDFWVDVQGDFWVEGRRTQNIHGVNKVHGFARHQQVVCKNHCQRLEGVFFVTLLACPAAEYLSSMLLSGNCEPPANEYLSVLSNVGQCGRSRSAWRIITGGITPTSSNTVIAVYTPSHMMCKHIKRVFYVSC